MRLKRDSSAACGVCASAGYHQEDASRIWRPTILSFVDCVSSLPSRVLLSYFERRSPVGSLENISGAAETNAFAEACHREITPAHSPRIRIGHNPRISRYIAGTDLVATGVAWCKPRHYAHRRQPRSANHNVNEKRRAKQGKSSVIVPHATGLRLTVI